MSAELPAAMTAIRIVEAGGPEVLQPATLPVPGPGAGEVLIRVDAAGVNRPDVMQRKGLYPPPPGASPLPGLEVSGTVVAVDATVEEWRIGDQVCALVAGGGYAEYCVAPAAQCLRVPKGLSAVEAAALPETFFTVWTNLFERAGLHAEDAVLIHGGASGIGTTAIQLARAYGARVLVTAGTAEKCRRCEALGAERAINYRTEDFVEVTRSLTAGRGVDIVLDMVGGDYVARNIAVLAPGGRHVSIAAQAGAKVAVDLVQVMSKRLILTGSTLRPRSVAEKGAIARSLLANVWPLLDAGTVRPVIDQTLPLTAAAEAHALLEQGEHVGKIVLVT